ncbi:MAG: hypothetical protein J5I93_25895 [Pirellulaceae bacterium]|nr:hypothetical protein [Pirellulaceae bacterium]
MNLSEWMDQEVAWRGRPEFLPDRGPAAGRVAGATGNEDRANLLLGGLFWQSYLASKAVERNVPSDLLRYVVEAEPMIVFHGSGLFTLLLEAPGLEKVVTVPASPTAGELEEGYFRYRSGWYFPESLSRRVSSIETSRNRELVHSQYQLSIEALWEVQGAQQPFVLTFADLPAENTSGLGGGPLEVRDPGGQFGPSTAGCWVQDTQGRTGVTAAAHAVPGVGGTVEVEGVPGTVRAHDPGFTDSAFVELALPGPSPNVSRGPLKKAPRQHGTCHFVGCRSQRQNAVVFAFNYELPAVDLDLQQRVVTDRVTARGDSGAGLLDDDGYLLGFAHKRSASSANPSWSSWIWALAVFEKHQLALCE